MNTSNNSNEIINYNNSYANYHNWHIKSLYRKINNNKQNWKSDMAYFVLPNNIYESAPYSASEITRLRRSGLDQICPVYSCLIDYDPPTKVQESKKRKPQDQSGSDHKKIKLC